MDSTDLALLAIGVIGATLLYVTANPHVRDRLRTRLAGAPAHTARSYVCTVCRCEGWPDNPPATNARFAFILLLFFVVPGVVYIILTARGVPTCPACGRKNTMIPADSARARALLERPPAALAAAADPEPAAAPVARLDRPCPFCGEPIPAAALLCRHCGHDVEALAP